MRNLISNFFLLLIKFYQMAVSPFFSAKCRYIPTCSEYSKQAIIKHGPLKGSTLTLKRLLKCHPWGGSGEDQVP